MKHHIHRQKQKSQSIFFPKTQTSQKAGISSHASVTQPASIQPARSVHDISKVTPFLARPSNKTLETETLQRLTTQESSTQPEILTLGGNRYTVKVGDSLWQIAQTVYGEGQYWQAIADTNPTQVAQNSDIIFVGTTLELPFIQIDKTNQDSSTSEVIQHPTPEPETAIPDESTALAEDQKITQDSNQSMGVNSQMAAQTPNEISPSETKVVNKTPTNLTDTSSTQQRNGNGKAPAVNCLMPALRHNLKGQQIELDSVTTPGCVFNLSLEMDGEMILQKQGVCNPQTLDQTNYITEFNRFVNEYKQRLILGQLSPTQATLTSSLSGNFTAMGVRQEAPTRWSYQSPLTDLKTTANGWMLGGKLGYKLQVELIPKPGITTPTVETNGMGSPESDEIAGPERFQQILEEDSHYLSGTRTQGISSTEKVPYMLTNQVTGFKFPDMAVRFPMATQMLKLKLKFAQK